MNFKIVIKTKNVIYYVYCNKLLFSLLTITVKRYQVAWTDIHISFRRLAAKTAVFMSGIQLPPALMKKFRPEKKSKIN